MPSTEKNTHHEIAYKEFATGLHDSIPTVTSKEEQNAVEKHGSIMKLIRLTGRYEGQLTEMLDEWMADIRENHTSHSPWAIFRNDWHDFERYLWDLNLAGDPDAGLVPESVLFLLDEERNRLIGAVGIRHHLNDFLLREGGHIGMGLRPSERNHGYGSEMLRLALVECKRMGIDRVLVVCDKDNIPSAKTILRNSGVLEDEIVNSKGVVVQRYWISI